MRRERMRGLGLLGLGLLGYLLLAVFMLSHTWFGGSLGDRLVGGGGDPQGFVWFLAWLPHAVAHGDSPLFTTILMAPRGANLLGSTSIFLPAFLLWPVTAIAGPVVSYDVLATLGLALSAFTASLAMRRITAHRSSAWIGGAIYGFGGYMTGQAAAHANLLIAIFPPLAAMLLDDVRKTDRPMRAGALLGLCAAAQVFVNEEILATTVIMALTALVFIAWLWRPSRALVRRYIRACATACAVFAILAGPALLYELFGPEHVHGVIVSSGRYVNDLAGFFVPNSLDRFSTAGARQLTGGFSGYDGEFGSYLGVPLLALLVFAGWRLRRRALLLWLLLLAAAVFSLGPHLHVLGHDTGVLMPWVLPNHLPLLENAIPSRFNLFIWLAAAALVVLLIDDLRGRPLLGSRALGIAVCAIALISVAPTLTSSELVRVPALLESAAALRRFAPQAKTVLIVPSTNGQQGMYAQARSDFAYRIPDGGVFVPNRDGASYGMRHGPLLYALATLGHHASTHAGRTRMDTVCLPQLAIDPMPAGSCKDHYLRALRALRIDAAVVSEWGSRSVAGRYVAFFTALLGSPQAAANAKVFIVTRP
ncbi:MAG TPA: hypothetical protein VGY76_04355 [Solirubrobacteraceae bacterium]|nr:hypothetical protein [Solirubrobacteraceae bacterium]